MGRGPTHLFKSYCFISVLSNIIGVFSPLDQTVYISVREVQYRHIKVQRRQHRSNKSCSHTSYSVKLAFEYSVHVNTAPPVTVPLASNFMIKSLRLPMEFVVSKILGCLKENCCVFVKQVCHIYRNNSYFSRKISLQKVFNITFNVVTMYT